MGIDKRYKGVEKRSHPRRTCSNFVEFRFSSSKRAKIHTGSAVNISDSGMCVYAFNRLKEGDTIEIVNEIPVPHRKATVRWVKECCEDFYKIIITFVE